MDAAEEAGAQRTLPTYLTAAYIKRALENAFATTVDEIAEFCVRPAIADGENFCSAIYRVQVRFAVGNAAQAGRGSGNGSAAAVAASQDAQRLRALSLIVKDMNMEIAAAGSSEYAMYESVLPQLERILRSASDGVERQLKLRANCLWRERGEREVYVLEDLNAAGYSVADRWRGLDEAHAAALLTKLAQFHAASMVLVEQSPAAVAALHSSHFARGAADPLAAAIAVGGTTAAIKVVEQWPDFEEIAAKMRTNLAKFDERVMALVKPQNSRWNVINHGDLWVNNALFSYDGNGAPADVVFVDFQNCFWSSPGFDINYVLNTSVQLPVLQCKRFVLLRHYYATLKSTLRRCGAKAIPSWQQIMEEVRNCEFIGYYAAVCELPLVCMSKEASAGFSAAIFNDAQALAQKNALLYSDERVLLTLRYALDRFNELGVLDEC